MHGPAEVFTVRSEELQCGELSPHPLTLLYLLALEPLVTRSPRNEAAKTLIKQLRSQVESSDIEDSEKAALVGILDNLHTESSKSALMRLADRIEGSPQISERPIEDFLSEYTRVRDRIAHKVEIESAVNLWELNEGPRQFVLSLIWTVNGMAFLASLYVFLSMPFRYLKAA